MSNDSRPTLLLPQADWSVLKRQSEAGYPNEICALLIGLRDGSSARITKVVSAANVHPDPRRQFEVDPATLLRSHRDARENALELLGVFHTHPEHSAEMSPTDLARAVYAPPWWLISSVWSGDAALPNAFLWEDEHVGARPAQLILT